MSNHDGTPPIDVLLVEDSPGDVRLTCESLQEAPIENTPHVVTNGEEALHFLYQRGAYGSASRPALVLLDPNLPRKHGLEMLEGIRDESTLADIPIVGLTSSEAEEDVVRSDERQTNAYRTEPISPGGCVELLSSPGEFASTRNQHRDPVT